MTNCREQNLLVADSEIRRAVNELNHMTANEDIFTNLLPESTNELQIIEDIDFPCVIACKKLLTPCRISFTYRETKNAGAGNVNVYGSFLRPAPKKN